MISALQVLSLMKRTEKPLSELAKAMTAMPQVLLNVNVTKKPNLDTIPELQRAICEGERVSTAADVCWYATPEPNRSCG